MYSNFIKLSLNLLLISVAGFSFSQTAENIIFEKTTQKFMKVDEGHQVTLTYNFSYTGDSPISIIPPKVDCTCTEVILPNEKISPKSTNVIKIKFDTKDKIGFQERQVAIHFVSDKMDSKSIEKKLIFKGMVKASKKTKATYKKH